MSFPSPKVTALRPAQKSALAALGSFTNTLGAPRVAMLEAPTGVGKSLIAMLTAEAMGASFTVVNTATISLQEQYAGDFPNLVILKGKNNFRCSLAEHLTPAEAPCIMTGEQCDSPYYEQERQFQTATQVVTNYALYFAELLRGRRWFDKRPQLVVCDEAHRLLDIMTEAEAVTLDMGLADELGLPSPALFKLGQARDWANTHLNRLETMAKANILGRTKQAGKYARLLRQAENILAAPAGLIPTITGETFKAVPLWPYNSAEKLVESTSKLLLMSATLWGGGFFAQLLSLPSDYLYVGLGSQFPSDRWPVYYRPVAKMTKNSTNADWTAMSSACHDLMHGTEEKGIIHVASYKHSEKVGREIQRCSDCRERLVTTRLGESRGETIGRYRENTGAWLVHPNVGEGESFDDEQCRYQIIAKLRYPDLSDPVVSLRAKDSGFGSRYYFHSTAAYTAQTVGRGMRHTDDHCENYIFDASFGRLYDTNKKAFPEWFKEQLR